jgi:hypothetical protein
MCLDDRREIGICGAQVGGGRGERRLVEHPVTLHSGRPAFVQPARAPCVESAAWGRAGKGGDMKHRHTWLAVVVLAAASALAATGAFAATGNTQVDGIQTTVTLGEYDHATDDVFWMDGNGGGAPGLIGYWYTRSITYGVFTPSGVITATGTEEFDGCLDTNGDRRCGASEPTGTLRMRFQATIKVDPLTFVQIQGRCHHPITGGTDDFRYATGMIRFKDDPAAGCSYYTGHISLG